MATTYKYTKLHIPHLPYVALFFFPIAHVTFYQTDLLTMRLVYCAPVPIWMEVPWGRDMGYILKT